MSDFRHEYPILDTSVRFQALVSDFRNILDTSVHFWTLVPDFEEKPPILDSSVRF